MRFTLICYIVLFVFASTQAQDVSGIVVNRQGEPISGAIVLELGTQNIATTDASGIFKLPTKNTFISGIISSRGYESFRKIFRPNDHSRIVLKESKEEEIRVFTIENRVARSKRNISENSSITVSDIKFQSVALNTLVDQPTGFVVESSGDMGTRPSYAMEGVSRNRKQFFIDGIPAEYFGGSFAVSNLPVSLIDRVEMNTNTNAMSYMSNTQGDVINLKTKLAFDDTSEISYAIGSYNSHHVFASGFSRNEKTGFTFRGVVFYNYSDNNYKVWGDDIKVADFETGEIKEDLKVERFNDTYQNAGGKVDLGVTTTSWADQFFISAWFANKYDEVQHGATMEIPFGERFYRQEAFMPSLTYQKENLFWKGFDLQFYSAYAIKHSDVNDVSKYNYNWLGEKFESENPGEQEYAVSYIDNNTGITRATIDYSFSDKHAVTVSNVNTNLIRKENNVKAPIEEHTKDDNRKIRKNIFGISYKNKSLDHSLETSFFGKLMGYKVQVEGSEYNAATDMYERTDYVNVNNKFGFGVAVNYTIHPNWLFQSSLEKAITLPEADEFFGSPAGNVLSTYNAIGFAELKPEESVNTKVGVSYKTDDRNDHRFHFGGHFLMRKVKNYIQPTVTKLDGFDYFIYENHKKIMSSEIELQVDYRFLNSLDVSVSTAYTNARNKASENKEGKENVFLNSRLKNEPYFQVNSGMNYRLYRGYFDEKLLFTFSWSMRYVHEFLRDWEVKGIEETQVIPSQFTNNFGVNYRFPNNATYLNLEARNVFNEQVFDKYAIQQQGRAIYFKIGHSF